MQVVVVQQLSQMRSVLVPNDAKSKINLKYFILIGHGRFWNVVCEMMPILMLANIRWSNIYRLLNNGAWT